MKSLPQPGSGVKETNENKIINHTERKLLKIWKHVLKNQEISIFDNFFECGGDSILSIQISSLAKEDNIFITSKDIFEKQTIQELAKIAESKEVPELSQSEVFGTTPLTPIQHWFFNQNFTDVHHWNQSLTLVGYPLLDKYMLDEIMFHIVKHHDGLRTRYDQNKNDAYLDKNMFQNQFWSTTYLDYSELNDEEKQENIKEIEITSQQSINIYNGPIMNLVCIKTKENEHRLIWIIHHLVVDGISWRILMEDFDQLYFQIVEDEKLELKKKTTSFREWANKLHDYGKSIPRDIDNYWEKECNKVYENKLARGEEQYNEKVFEMTLPKKLTDLIYNDISKFHVASIDEIYLSLFTRLIGNYFNKKMIPIHLEGHGREEVFENIDISRTVGWFTTIFPITLENHESLSKVIAETKRKVREIPNKGIDYGILTELSRKKYSNHHQPVVSFNNLGKFDMTHRTGAREVHLFSDHDIKNNNYQAHEIEIELLLVEDKQKIKIIYNENFVKEDFENYMSEELVVLIRKMENTSGIDAANISKRIPNVQMETEELNQLLLKEPEIVDIYNLSILQKGMLYHSLFDSENSQYKVQLIYEVEGFLDEQKIKEAIETAVGKHDMLKTKFYSDKKGQFYQLKMTYPNVSIDYKDLIADLDKRLEELIDKEYKSIDIESNRLNAFLIIKLADNNHLIVWSFHHIIMDGWSYSMVINDIFNCYRTKKQVAIETTSFKSYVEYMEDYVKWEKLKQFWINQFKNYSNHDSYLFDTETIELDEYNENVYYKEIDERMKNSIQQFCKEFKVTSNSFFLTIWLATLKELKGTDHVCCGVVTSGRNIPVKNIGKIVGPMINTIPFIKEIENERPYGELVKEVQDEFLEFSTYENTPLSKVYEWTETDYHLFESLYSFDNYPMTLPNTSEFNVRLKETKEITHYPIAIIINPNKEVQFKFNEAVISKDMRVSIITTFNRILDELLANKKLG